MGKKRAGAPCKSETQLWTAAWPTIDVGRGYLFRFAGPVAGGRCGAWPKGAPPRGTSPGRCRSGGRRGAAAVWDLSGMLPLWWSLRGRRRVGLCAGSCRSGGRRGATATWDLSPGRCRSGGHRGAAAAARVPWWLPALRSLADPARPPRGNPRGSVVAGPHLAPQLRSLVRGRRVLPPWE
jgi:hypothetical protein